MSGADIDNLRIQLRSARQIAEAFREDARVHREKCEEQEREIEWLRYIMKVYSSGCGPCVHGNTNAASGGDCRAEICQRCRRFTGLGEDLWEV